MSPEYGATCGFFPVDAAAIDYLKTSGRAAPRVALVQAYAKAQGLFRTAKSADPVFTETLTLDLGDVVPSMAGPKRPEGRIALPAVAEGFSLALSTEYKKADEPAAGTVRSTDLRRLSARARRVGRTYPADRRGGPGARLV